MTTRDLEPRFDTEREARRRRLWGVSLAWLCFAPLPLLAAGAVALVWGAHDPRSATLAALVVGTSSTIAGWFVTAIDHPKFTTIGNTICLVVAAPFIPVSILLTLVPLT